MNWEIVLRVLFYAFYRILRCLSHSLQDLVYGRPKGNVQIMQITKRLKLNLADKWTNADMRAKPDDFSWNHMKFSDVETLLDPHWQLYCMTPYHAYFLLLPKPIQEYNVRASPFLFAAQFEDAQQIARLSLDDFKAFSQTLQKPKDLLFLWSGARCGSTLLASALQIPPTTLSLSEPYVFADLYVLKKTESVKHIAQLAAAAVVVLSKDSPDHTIVFKPTSMACILHQEIKTSFPRSKHIYIFRRDVPALLLSFKRIMLSMKISTRTTFMLKWLPFLCQQADMATNPPVVPFTVEDEIDIPAVHIAEERKWCRNNRDRLDMAPVVYEDLIKEPEKVLKNIFKVCGLNNQHLNEAMESLKTDSQRESILGKMQLGGGGPQHFNEDKERLREIAQILRLEEDFFEKEDIITK